MLLVVDIKSVRINQAVGTLGYGNKIYTVPLIMPGYAGGSCEDQCVAYRGRMLWRRGEPLSPSLPGPLIELCGGGVGRASAVVSRS